MHDGIFVYLSHVGFLSGIILPSRLPQPCNLLRGIISPYDSSGFDKDPRIHSQHGSSC